MFSTMKSNHIFSRFLTSFFSLLDNGKRTPLPGLPQGVQQMTNAEIRDFIKANDERKLKDEQILIKRGKGYLEVIIRFRWHTEHMAETVCSRSQSDEG